MKHIEPGTENTSDGFGDRIVPTIAVVGAGHWGRNLVRNFNDLGALEIVCDTDPEILKHIREVCRGADRATEYSEALSNSLAQAVVIATPAGMQADMARAAELLQEGLAEALLAQNAGHMEHHELEPWVLRYFNTSKVHTVVNHGESERITLAIDSWPTTSCAGTFRKFAPRPVT